MPDRIDIADTFHAPLLAQFDFTGAGYSVLLREGAPLLLVPPVKDVAALTLGLYLPQSRKARLAMQGLRLACRAGTLSHLLPALSGGVRREAADSAPVAQADIDAGRVGFLLCNPDHACARTVGVKLAEKPQIFKWAARPGDAAIRQEAETLRRLSGQGTLGVSPVLTAGGDTQTAWLEMPYLDRLRVSSVAEPSAIALLSAWMRPESVNPLETEFLRSFWTAETWPSGQWAFERLGRLRVRKALVHGDFAVWNLRADQGAPVAIDWEWAREDGLAGLDLCYGLLQEALLTKRLPPFEALRVVRRAAEAPACRRYLAAAGWGDALDLWLVTGVLYRHARKPCPEVLEVL